MGNLFSSKQKTTSTQATKIPSNFQNLMNRTISFANQGLDTPFESYNAPRIANLSANEQAGIASAGANAGMYQDLINMASMNNAAMQVEGGVPTQGDLDQFINPYVDYVLGNTLGRLNEASDRNMTNIGSMAGMAGAFGGSRHGVLEGANLAELLKSTQEASANTYSDAFDKGMGNWFNSQNLRRGTIQDAMGIVRGGQDYNTQDINNLMGTGLTERTRNQGVLDFAYSEFLREQGDPYTKANFASSVMQSYPTNLFTRTGVQETTNTPSPFSQIAGVGLAAAGLMTGNPAALSGLAAGSASLGDKTVQSPAGGVGWGAAPKLPWQMAKGGQVKGYKKGGSVKKDKIELPTDMNDPLVQLAAYLFGGTFEGNPDSVFTRDDKDLSRVRRLQRFQNERDIRDKGNYESLLKLQKAFRTPLDVKKQNFSKFNKESDEVTKYNEKILNQDLSLQDYLEELVDPNVKRSRAQKRLTPLQNRTLIDRELNSVPTDSGGILPHIANYAVGGRVEPGKDGVYRAGSGGLFDSIMRWTSPVYAAFDNNPSQKPSMDPSVDYGYGKGFDQYGDPISIKKSGGFNLGHALLGGALLGDQFGGSKSGGGMQEPNRILYGDRASTQGGVQPQQRQPFNWEEFIQRQGLESFMTPKFPNQATPRLPAQGPNLGHFVQALQSKLGASGGGGSPLANFRDGGPIIISGNKKTRRNGSRLWDGVEHDGSREDITYLLDNIPDEEWTPTEDSFDGTHQPIQVDEKEAWRLALQKHETGASEYEKPNYFANSFRGKEGSHAFGLGQWQPSSWNAMASSYNQKNKDKVRFMTQEDVKANRLPSKDEQDKVWGLWEKQLLRKGKNDYARAFAEHQLGQGDLTKVLSAPMNAKMKTVVGDQIAKNISAKNETVGEYFDRLKSYINEAKDWKRNKLASTHGNVTDVVSSEPTEDYSLAAERPEHNFGGFTEDQIRAAMRKTNNKVFAGVQPDGRRDRVRRGPNLGQPLSPLETIMGGKLAEPAEKDYLKSLIPGLIEQEDLPAPSRFTQGLPFVSNKDMPSFQGGGYVKGYAEGGETEAQKRYREAINASRKAVGMDPLNDGTWGASFRDAATEAGQRSNQAHDEVVDLFSLPWQSNTRAGRGVESVGRGLASLVPMSAELVGRGVQGGANVLDFLFGDMTKEGKPNSIKAPTASSSSKSLSDLNMGIPDYGQGENTGASAFNTALEEGEPDAIVTTPAQEELSRGEDALTSALREMIMQEVENRKNYKEKDNNQLFGMNVNMPLIKMGLGILANSGYPNSAGEAIGKGVLGAIEGEEQDTLKKQERDNNKLKELVNLRYMQAMVESMDPNIKLQLQREKLQQEALMKKFKSQTEFDLWLAKQPYNEEMQKRLIKYRADIAAAANNPFGDLGEGRTDLSGE